MNKRHHVLKKVASAPRSSFMLTSSPINCVGAAANNANSRSLPRRCKEPYPIDGGPVGTPLYGNFRNKRSVCREDVPVVGSKPQAGGAGDECYELSVDFQQKQIEILARQYGGHFRARRAAVVIQRAYRKHSMNKKFERLRKRSSVAAASPANRLFVSNIEIDTNESTDYKNKYLRNNRKIAAGDNSVAPLVGNLNDSTRRNFNLSNVAGHSSTAVADELDYKSVTNQIDVSSISTPIIAVKSKEPNCSTSSSVGQQSRKDHQQYISSRSHNKQRAVSAERNLLYSATTNLNATPIETDTFKVATTSNVVDERKIFNNNNSNSTSTSTVLSPVAASTSSSDSQYVSYVRVECASRREDGDDEDLKLFCRIGDSNSSTGSERLKPCKTPVFFASAPTKDDNYRTVAADQFYSPIKLHEKSKASLHQTKSVDSVKDLCITASSSAAAAAGSSSDSGDALSHSSKLKRNGKQGERCLSSKLSTPLAAVSPMSPIWVPRSHSPIKIAVDNSEISNHQPGGTYVFNNSNSASAKRNNIQSVESRLLHHWVWGRPTLYRASMRRNDIERRRQYRIALNFFNK